MTPRVMGTQPRRWVPPKGMTLQNVSSAPGERKSRQKSTHSHGPSTATFYSQLPKD